jgi:phage shock protein A
LRKRETEDLAAGIQQQLAAAASTREHLSTTLRAIEARLAEAQRRRQELLDPGATAPAGKKLPARRGSEEDHPEIDRTRAQQIEADLEALRRELQGPS